MRARLTTIGLGLAGAALILGQNFGCYAESASQWQPVQTAQPPHAGQAGQVYYLDGAGGGGMTGGWGPGVRKGLEAAGYQGGFDNFPWQTKMGVVTDQVASAKFKRARAVDLSKRIREIVHQSPDRPVNLIGLSAGTAVAVFALEALPENCLVDDVVLLGSSLSSQHDLTSALKHVDNRMYVFTSNKDTVLRFLVPISGTADRQRKAGPAAGVGGFRLPPGASPETRRLYAKVW